MNVSKANYICTGENVMPAVKNAIAQDKIFEAQLQNYINKPVPSVAILNAFPFLYLYMIISRYNRGWGGSQRNAKHFR